jgi:diguanylate cyclase (GGDEF)-like protein
MSSHDQVQPASRQTEAPSPPAQAEKRRMLELNVLRDISTELSTSLDVPRILHAVSGHLPKLFDYALLAILVEEEPKPEVFLYPQSRPEAALVDAGLDNLLALYSLLGDQPCGRADVEAHVFDEAAQSQGSRFSDAGSEIRSHVAFPLVASGETFGYISLYSLVDEAFQPADLSVFSLLTHQIAAAVRNAQLFQRVQEMAVTDFLTGLYNRRHLEQLLDREYSRAIRYGHPLSVIIMDVDHLKEVNDTLGHPAGDLVLQQVSSLLCQSVRQADVVTRYGGDEFALLLPETSLEQAMILAERLRVAVQQQVPVTLQHGLNLTISLGLATLEENGACSKETLVRRADDALLYAKSRGRNRVCLYSPRGGMVETDKSELARISASASEDHR